MHDPADIQRLKANADLVALFEADGSDVVRAGSRHVCACPFHTDATPSCYIFDDNKFPTFKCFGCDAHGDAIEYLMRRRSINFDVAVQFLGGIPEPAKPRKGDQRVKYTCVQPIPTNAPRCTFQINANGVSDPTAIYWYLSQSKQRLMAVVRYNSTNEKGEVSKTIRPWSWARRDSDGSYGWQMARPDDGLPLYGLDRLADKPDLPVLIVEGEKSADAAQQYFPFHACISWPGGAKAIDKVDWSPIAGRHIILWADYDHAGACAMLDIWDKARAHQAASIKAVDLDRLQPRQKGWDVADASKEDAEICIDLLTDDVERSLARLTSSLPGQPIKGEKSVEDKKTGSGAGDNNGQPPTENDHSDESGFTFEANDIYAASRFVADNKGKVLYCPAWERWHVWDGMRWKGDDEGVILQMAEATALRMARDYIAEGEAATIKARDNSKQARAIEALTNPSSEQVKKAAQLLATADALRKQAKQAKAKAEQVQSLKRMRDMLELAKTRRDLIVQTEELDSEEHLFNTNTGVVNLQTGEIYKHDSKRRITRLAPVDYDPSTPPGEIARVLKHLLQVRWNEIDVEEKRCSKDKIGKLNEEATEEMGVFAQNILGNSLQGNNRLERFYVWQGPGGSGKGTMMESIKAAIGDYCMTAEFQSFIKTQGTRIRDDLARLAEARFVLASESEQGEQLAAGVVKAITGRDTITARQLYGSYFEFRPKLTLHLQCNDLPRVDDQDSGLWRRLVLIPCGPQIPEDKADHSLKDWLLDPARGGKAMLAWLIAGSIRTYKMKRIPEPLTVKAASAAYRRDQDPTKEFFADSLRFSGPLKHFDTRTGTTDLLKAYAKWCDDNHLAARLRCSPKTISHRLENLGCYRKKVRVGTLTPNAWIGVCLLPDVEVTVPTTHRPTDDEHTRTLGALVSVPVFPSSADLEKPPTHTHARAPTSDSTYFTDLEEQRNTGTIKEPTDRAPDDLHQTNPTDSPPTDSPGIDLGDL